MNCRGHCTHNRYASGKLGVIGYSIINRAASKLSQNRDKKVLSIYNALCIKKIVGIVSDWPVCK